MAAAKRVRWECPAGLHPGVLGSSRPRKDATVRFCWPCSQEAGVLVERVAPSLERQREAKREAATARRRREGERERQKRAQALLVACLDVDANEVVLDAGELLREAWRSSALVEARSLTWAYPRMVRMPVLKVRRGKVTRAMSDSPARVRDRMSGHAKPGQAEIVLTCAPGLGEEWLRAIVVHEAAHAALPVSERHGTRWQRYYIRAVRELYDVEPGVLVDEVANWRLDELIAAAIMETRRGS